MKKSHIQRTGWVGLVGVIAILSYQPVMQANQTLPPTVSAAKNGPSKPSLTSLLASARRSVQQPMQQSAQQPVQAPVQAPLTDAAIAADAAFVSVSHPTSGAARIVEVEGQRYLEFDEAFRSDDGPDLFVLLHREAVPESYGEQDYTNLGRLQQLAGTQRYVIPADLDLQMIASAVIWCEDFNVTFGYATF